LLQDKSFQVSMKKKVDSRIRTLLENGIKMRHRSIFVIVGDRGRDQVVNFHYLLSKMVLKGRPNVLWCYKKELGFSSHKKKRMKEIQKLQKKGLYDNDQDEPFELFIGSTDIRFCYYKETQNVLGNTYGMLVLQDFESLTPNILCRTIETVEGGGLVILLLKTMTSLKQLFSMTMDIHTRFRTEAHEEIRPLFNERLILSLAGCRNCLFMDDELNILNISSLAKEIAPITAEDSLNAKINKQLADLKESLKQNQILGPLVSLARTYDQANALMQLFDGLVEKNVRYTISMTAGRGRGKSAAMGIIIAGAIASGFSSIFVTAPSPENLKTLFEFIFKGLEALGYQEHAHYEAIQSTNPDFNKAIVRVNINKNHKQMIQYIQPQDYAKCGNADLMVIDEASAIPLTHVKKLLGPYMVFLSSTVNGYEGTGRSLSVKLIQKLREQSKITGENKSSTGGRLLRETTLNDPIRYSLDDPIEKWLYDLLCLDATEPESLRNGLPHPNDCELFLVNRETLFAYHKATEKFLFRLMSLFVSSHYKNSPNDLQLLSDAPAHAVFVLLGPLKQDAQGKNETPDILCAVQVCLEGKISKKSVMDHTLRGLKPSGDLIPWTVSEQYQDNDFPQLNGVRVVRIATHANGQKMGYGSKALELLDKFFESKLISLDEDVEIVDFERFDFSKDNIVKEGETSIAEESLKPKRQLKPLLKRLGEVRPPHIDYLGVSFGLTHELFNFWGKNKYVPVYLRQTINETTAEHTCVMIKALQTSSNLKANDTLGANEQEADWTRAYADDFQKRFVYLLGYDFNVFEVPMCLSILNPNLTSKDEEAEEASKEALSKEDIQRYINLFDLKRLEAYSKNLVDYRLITDLLPALSQMFFLNKLPKSLKLSYAQAAILIGLGLQYKHIDNVSAELKLPASQALALFNKAIRKITNQFKRTFEKDVEKTLKNRKLIDVELNPIKNKNSQADEMEVVSGLMNKGGNKQKNVQSKGRTLENTEDQFDEEIVSSKEKGGNLDTIVIARKEEEDGRQYVNPKHLPKKGGNKFQGNNSNQNNKKFKKH